MIKYLSIHSLVFDRGDGDGFILLLLILTTLPVVQDHSSLTRRSGLGIVPWPLAVKLQSPNHWITREFPSSLFLTITLGGYFYHHFTDKPAEVQGETLARRMRPVRVRPTVRLWSSVSQTPEQGCSPAS